MKHLDANFDKLRNQGSGKVNALQRAIDSGDGRQIFAKLASAYGSLSEVVFLKGPYMAKSVLVFADGVGLSAGADSYIPILTFGYQGQGSKVFSTFLAAAGFSDTDATAVVAPVRLGRDGTRVLGEVVDGQIMWQDGTSTLLDI